MKLISKFLTHFLHSLSALKHAIKDHFDGLIYFEFVPEEYLGGASEGRIRTFGRIVWIQLDREFEVPFWNENHALHGLARSWYEHEMSHAIRARQDILYYFKYKRRDYRLQDEAQAFADQLVNGPWINESFFEMLSSQLCGDGYNLQISLEKAQERIRYYINHRLDFDHYGRPMKPVP